MTWTLWIIVHECGKKGLIKNGPRLQIISSMHVSYNAWASNNQDRFVGNFN